MHAGVRVRRACRRRRSAPQLATVLVEVRLAAVRRVAVAVAEAGVARADRAGARARRPATALGERAGGAAGAAVGDAGVEVRLAAVRRRCRRSRRSPRCTRRRRRRRRCSTARPRWPTSTRCRSAPQFAAFVVRVDLAAVRRVPVAVGEARVARGDDAAPRRRTPGVAVRRRRRPCRSRRSWPGRSSSVDLAAVRRRSPSQSAKPALQAWTRARAAARRRASRWRRRTRCRRRRSWRRWCRGSTSQPSARVPSQSA